MFRFVSACLILLTVSFGAGSVLAQGDADCTTSKCHADMGTKAFVHGPVGAGICTVCHNRVEGEDHKFKFVAEKDELCFACHEAKRDMMLEDFLHTPVEEGNCIGCHDPHQSEFRFTLLGQAADLCMKCHDQKLFSMDHVHGPVGVGDCNVCHNPHASANEKQLVRPEKELCFQCHKEKEGMMDERHVHPPVAENCTNCHNPHSEKGKFLLPDDPPKLCFGCHPESADFAYANVPHQPVADGRCGACHDPHSSPNPKLFTTEQTGLCFSCHDEMGEYVATHDKKHGPVQQGDCNACHNPHGSEYNRILRNDFPKEFYMPYATENYDICFQCHNKTIALDSLTTTLTDFRNGDVNLHYLHVNKNPKGRSCKACHQVHASNQEKHIRTSVPFGSMNWELPVTYTKFDDGGSCVVGCHAPKEYRRQ